MNSRHDLQVFLINLDASPDRLRDSGRLLQQAGLEFIRVPGVDGARLSAADIAQYDPQMGLRRYGRILRPGKIGCGLGHRRALQHFLQSGAAYGFILEDDHACAPSLAGLIDDVIDALSQPGLQDWNVVNFSHDHTRRMTPVAEIDDAGTPRALLAAHDFPARGVARLWSRKGAQGFLDHTAPLYAPQDLMLQDFCAAQGGGFVLSPTPVPCRGLPSDLYQLSRAAESAGIDVGSGAAPLSPLRAFLRMEARNLRNLSRTLRNRRAFRRMISGR